MGKAKVLNYLADTQAQFRAYTIYIQSLAAKLNKSEAEIGQIVSRDGFLNLIYSEYERFQRSEYTFGKLIEVIGVGAFALDEILITLGLSVHH